MIKQIQGSYAAPALEKEVQEFWKKEQAYEKTKAAREKGENFYFMDGPPYTTGSIHLGTAVTWTEWSCMDEINFNLPGDHDKTVPLKWNDTWRVGLGAAYDLTESLTLMGSYIFDQDPCRKYYGSSMLPPGDRHIGALGVSWHYRSIEITVGYANHTVEIPASFNLGKHSKVTLHLGMDLPLRNSLKHLEKEIESIHLVVWDQGPNLYRYGTVVKAKTGIGIFACYHANMLVV